MRHLLIALLLITTIPLAMAADAPPDATSLTPIEKQLRTLERQVDAFYSAQEDFNKGAADFESKPRLKKILCTTQKDFVPKTLREFRANADSLEQQRANMSEDQQNRLSVCQSRLEKASPEHPACAGI